MVIPGSRRECGLKPVYGWGKNYIVIPGSRRGCELKLIKTFGSYKKGGPRGPPFLCKGRGII